MDVGSAIRSKKVGVLSVGHFRYLPVIEDSELLGVITLRDVLDNMLDIPSV